MRIQGGDDCAPGSAYHLAFLTSEDNGLAGAIDLARTLDGAGRPEVRRQALEISANAFSASPQAVELRALIR